MASVQHRMYRKNGVLYNYDNDDIFCRGDMSYFDCSISQCVLDSEVLGLYEALCNTQSVIETCSCLVVPKDPFGCKPVIDESKCSSICLQINQLSLFRELHNDSEQQQQHSITLQSFHSAGWQSPITDVRGRALQCNLQFPPDFACLQRRSSGRCVLSFQFCTV